MNIEDIKDKEVRELAKLRRGESTLIFADDLGNAFNWSLSKEGYDFWESIENKGVFETKEKNTPPDPLSLDDVNDEICRTMEIIKSEFCQKNNDYNNSLHRPNIFGQDPVEGLKARMSDKLNRIISKGFDDKTEDSMRDLFGYYIHYCIMRK